MQPMGDFFESMILINQGDGLVMDFVKE